MTLVAGIDSSTQSCKVVIRDAETGALVRIGRADHPAGTEVDPELWWTALQAAIADAGGLGDVAAAAVGGQQHGMVALDADGRVVRDALLWNDTRSAGAARQLTEKYGAQFWADRTGSVPVASYTMTKIAWMAEAEPENAARTAAVALPHDWLTWRLAGHGGPDGGDLAALVTDRSDASGTSYWSPATGEYLHDLVLEVLGHDLALPRVVGPGEQAATGAGGYDGLALGAGAGDNAAAALGLGLGEGDVAVSLGTSGVVSAVSPQPTADPTGLVSGFADATGRFLPLACTLNAARVLDATARILGVDHKQLARLALDAPAGSDGLVLVPYLEGERTPNKPNATGAVHGLRLDTSTPSHLARAAVEGMLSGLADGLDALRAAGVVATRLMLIGGAAQSPAVHEIAPTVFGMDVELPEPGEYVANGAARQAAWILAGGDEPPTWSIGETRRYAADDAARSASTLIAGQYASARDQIVDRA